MNILPYVNAITTIFHEQTGGCQNFFGVHPPVTVINFDRTHRLDVQCAQLCPRPTTWTPAKRRDAGRDDRGQLRKVTSVAKWWYEKPKLVEQIWSNLDTAGVWQGPQGMKRDDQIWIHFFRSHWLSSSTMLMFAWGEACNVEMWPLLLSASGIRRRPAFGLGPMINEVLDSMEPWSGNLSDTVRAAAIDTSHCLMSCF